MSIAVNIEKTLGDFQLNTEFYANIGITAIFGPSGAGKSTLVNLIAGLVKPDTGYIKILNEVIFESQLKINVPANKSCLLYTSPSPRDLSTSRMPSSA